jgi:hypothetical protein
MLNMSRRSIFPLCEIHDGKKQYTYTRYDAHYDAR